MEMISLFLRLRGVKGLVVVVVVVVVSSASSEDAVWSLGCVVELGVSQNM